MQRHRSATDQVYCERISQSSAIRWNPYHHINMIWAELFSMSQMECYPKIRQRGVITIPEEVRDGLGLEEGDQLKLTVEKLE